MYTAPLFFFFLVNTQFLWYNPGSYAYWSGFLPVSYIPQWLVGLSICHLSPFLLPTPPSLTVGDRQNSSPQLQPQPQPVHIDTANWHRKPARSGFPLPVSRRGGGGGLSRWWLCTSPSDNLQAFPGAPSGWGKEWQERRRCSQQGDYGVDRQTTVRWNSHLCSGASLRCIQAGDEVSSQLLEDCFQNDLQEEEKRGKARHGWRPE